MKNLCKGQSLLQAMIVLAAMGLLAASVTTIVGAMNKQSRTNRVKAEMSAYETRIRNLMKRSDSWEGCPNCTLKQSVRTKILEAPIRPLLGCKGPATDCGLDVVDVARAQQALRSVERVVVSYNGDEVKVKNLEFFVIVPGGTPDFSCAVGEPLLISNNNGDPVCAALPSDCAPGTFLKSVEWDKHPPKYNCQSLGTTEVKCGDGEYAWGIEWLDGLNFKLKCRGRYDPWTKMPSP